MRLIRQQSIPDYSKSPAAFVERSLREWDSHERRVTDVHSICIIMLENNTNFALPVYYNWTKDKIS